MPPRVPLLQMVERLVDGAHFQDRRWLSQRDARVLARVDGGHRLEIRDERERLALFEHDVLDVRRGDRFEPTLAQRLADNAWNQFVCNVVQNLVLVALPDNGRRHLARAKPGHARGFAVATAPPARSRRRRRQVRPRR